MPHAHIEVQLVDPPAIWLFAQLGSITVLALEETFGVTGALLRKTKGDVPILHSE